MNMKILPLYSLILYLFFTSCDISQSSTIQYQQMNIVPFKVLFNGFQTEKEIDDFESIALSGQNDAAAFLNDHVSEFSEDHKLLKVNYSDSLVLGAFTGARPNTSYSLEIDSVFVDGQNVQVFATETGSSVGGRAIVWPAQFVSLSKTDVDNREINFILSRVCEVSPCEWEE